MKKTSMLFLALLAFATLAFSLNGTLSVTSNPSSANLYVNNSYRGTTPINVSLATGSYILNITKAGYYTNVSTVSVQANRTTSVFVTLIRIQDQQQNGTLSVTSNPSSANLYVNNSYKGTTPINVSLAAGAYSLLISKAGYYNNSTSVQIIAGNVSFYRAQLAQIQQQQQNGTLSVQSNPTNATILLNGTNRGSTPNNISLAPGYYLLNVTMAGYYPNVSTIQVLENQTRSAFVTLTQIQQQQQNGTYLRITSYPSNAMVFVNNSYVGNTSSNVGAGAVLGVQISINPGRYEILVTKEGYRNSSANVTVRANQVTSYHFGLGQVQNQQQNQTGSLFVITYPTGASLYVDNSAKGATPTTVANLSVGAHSVLLTKANYTNYTGNVNITANQTFLLNVTLTR